MKLFAQLVVGGVAQGALYALVALGFVIIYKSTDVINFAQGGLVLLGAYICFTFNGQWGWPFYPSVIAAMAVAAVLGLAIERLILRRMIGQPNYAIIMITIGLSIAIDQIVIWKWTGSQRNFGDPWGLDTYKVGGVVIPVVNVVQIIAAGALLVGFFALFWYSRVGIAMRATASDEEAALAQGISVKRVFGLSWAIAAAIGALAGVLLVSGGRGLGPDLSFVALAAFPAIILGGLDSAGGAVVGGLVMGLVQSLTAGYNDKLPAVLGPNFNRVTPYVVLVAILMVRPYGLFGTREVTRGMTQRGSHRLVVDYGNDLRLFPSWLSRTAIAVIGVLWIVLPMQIGDFQLSVLNRAGIFAIGARVNLLTGYAGQVSLGHAFFMAVGAYTWAHFGGEQNLPLLVWLPVAGVIGGLVGALIGPFALRLRGNYLAIVSLGLVFIGIHIWNNFESVTGGFDGVGGSRAARIGPLDFTALTIGGTKYSIEQAYFWLIWVVVGLAALATKNVVRSRPGRALQAIRDRDVAAAVIGVSLTRYKVSAFAVSSAMAAMCGALFGSYYGYISPDQWNLLLSIQFIAIIIVGGVGTVFGAIVGALFIAGAPLMIEQYSSSIPLVSYLTKQADMTVATLNQLLFGLVIILFLILEPRGLAGLWFRLKTYFKAWPFSY